MHRGVVGRGEWTYTKIMLKIIMEAKKKYTPQPDGPMVLNICGVKREMMKFQNQLLAAAEA